MELLNLLTGQPAAVALAILAMYWLNRNTLEFAREKREMLEIMRNERKEWMEQAREERRQLLDIQRSATESQSKVAHELHALRNTLTPLVPGIQFLIARFGGEAPRGATPGGQDGTR